MTREQQIVEVFHNSYRELLRNAAKERNLQEIERIARELTAIAVSGKECPNIAANLVEYARACYRNILATTPTVPTPRNNGRIVRNDTAHGISTDTIVRNGVKYTKVKAHYRRVS